MDAAQAAEPATPGAQTPPIGQLCRVCIADHDVIDRAAAIHENADLAIDLEADLRELAGELVRQQPIDGQSSAEDALELSQLVRPEPARIPKDLLNERLLSQRAPELQRRTRSGPRTAAAKQRQCGGSETSG